MSKKQEVVKQQPTDKVIPPTASKEQKTVPGAFSFDMDAAQYVVMILDKVDPVYLNEAKNAFARYNLEKYSDQRVMLTKDAIDKDKSIIIFSKFPSATVAYGYEERIKKDDSSQSRSGVRLSAKKSPPRHPIFRNAGETQAAPS